MMPKVIGNDSLIARVNEVQGCMYRQSNELGRLNKTVRRYKEENAKLRELVRKWYPHMARRVGKDVLAQWGQLDVLRELGIEVGNA